MINSVYNLLLIISVASFLWMPVLLFFYIFKYQDSISEAKERFMNGPWGITCIAFCILSILALTFTGNIMTKYAESEISSIIKQSPEIYINGNRIFSKEILNEIENITPKSGSRAWSDSIISIKLLKNTTVVELKVERNNDDSTLYSMYYPKYYLTRLNAIREFTTKSLSNY